MAADLVPLTAYHFHDRGKPLSAPAAEEERGLDPIPLQHMEHRGRIGGIRPVIERDGQERLVGLHPHDGSERPSSQPTRRGSQNAPNVQGSRGARDPRHLEKRQSSTNQNSLRPRSSACSRIRGFRAQERLVVKNRTMGHLRTGFSGRFAGSTWSGSQGRMRCSRKRWERSVRATARRSAAPARTTVRKPSDMRLFDLSIDCFRPLLRKPLQPLKHPLKSLRKLLGLCRYALKASESVSTRAVGLFLRGVRLVREHDFEPSEAYDLGLLREHADPADDPKYVSRSRMKALQEALNPASWTCLARQKDLFHRICESHGFPVPSLYAVAFPRSPGWTREGEMLGSPDAWDEFLTTQTSGDLVIKPADGYYGRGIRIYRRRGDHFLDSEGNSVSPVDLLKTVSRTAGPAGVLIQQRLVNHRTLRRLSGTENLQTLRIVTLIDENSTCHVLSLVLKVIVGDRVTDNYDGGRSGNLFAEVSMADGTLESAVRTDPNDGRLCEFIAHPTTGVRFGEVQVPFWEESLAAVTRAARVFFPLRTLGWDVGITDNGPRLVEANSWWETPKPLSGMPEIVARLSSAAAAINRPRREPMAHRG